MRCWVPGAVLNRLCRMFGSGVLGSIVIVAGGRDMSGFVIKSAELYDSAICIPSSYVDLTTGHAHTSCFVL